MRFFILLILTTLTISGCGKSRRLQSDPSCVVNGVSYAAGESMPSLDGCNRYWCSEQGDVSSTLMACAP